MDEPPTSISVSGNFLSLSLLSSFPDSARAYNTPDGLDFTMLPANGRVTDLTIDGRAIAFCSVGGTDLTGGFYLRDNTPTTIGGLPDGAGNLLDAGYSRFDGNTGDVIGDPASSAYWKRNFDGDPDPEPSVFTVGTNKVALIRVDESSNYPFEGHFGAIYHDQPSRRSIRLSMNSTTWRSR